MEDRSRNILVTTLNIAAPIFPIMGAEASAQPFCRPSASRRSALPPCCPFSAGRTPLTSPLRRMPDGGPHLVCGSAVGHPSSGPNACGHPTCAFDYLPGGR